MLFTLVTERPQLDLAAFIELLKRRSLLILTVAVLGGGLALGFSMLQPKKYEASADLLFRQGDPPPRIDPNAPPPDVPDAPERVAATNLALASLDTVARRVKDRLRSPLTPDELRDRVELTPQGQADLVTITANAHSPQASVRIANAFADAVVELRRQKAQRQVQRVIDAIERQLATAAPGSDVAGALNARAQQLRVEKRLQTGDVEVAEEAVRPLEPSSPRPVRNSLIGAGLGLILGVLIALLLRRLDRRIEDEDEIAGIVGAPLLARVPVEKDGGWERELFLESFQFLRSNLEMRDDEQHTRVIAVTSALPGDGKSTVVARLSEALAFSGKDVVAVDCDLRRPSLHQYFEVDGTTGVTNVIVGGRQPSEIARPTRIPGIRLVPAGPLIPIPASVVAATQRLGQMLQDLRQSADYVIVDTSPITIGAEASAVVAAAEGVVVIVDVQNATRDALRTATEHLKNAHARVAGIVANRAGVLVADSDYRGYYAAFDLPDSGRRRDSNGSGRVAENAPRAAPEAE